MNEKYEVLKQRAEAWIEEHKEEFIKEIQGLVRIPSVSRADLAEPGAPFGQDCRQVLDYALERGRHYGFATEDHDGYAGSVILGDREHTIGIIAHLDIVPVGEGWNYPPFDGVYLPEYDAMIGRGASDNKGPFVLGLFVMRMIREFGLSLRHGIRLIGGLSEETGMQDMKWLLENGMSCPVTSLVPDSAYPVNFAQKGSVGGEISIGCTGNLLSFDAGSVRNVVPDKAVCVIAADCEDVKKAFGKLDPEWTKPITAESCPEGTKLTAEGRAAHAAGPGAGINAIYVLTRALDASGLLTGDAAKAVHMACDLTSDPYGVSEGVAYRDEESGELTLVYGVAHLKDGRLTLSVDCRFSITLDGAVLSEKMKAAWTDRGFAVDRCSYTKPFYIAKDDPRTVKLQELYHDITGSDAAPYSMGGGTYSRVVPDAITFGISMPTAVDPASFLPEGHGGAHGRDEVLVMEKIWKSAVIYLLAIIALDELLD